MKGMYATDVKQMEKWDEELRTNRRFLVKGNLQEQT